MRSTDEFRSHASSGAVDFVGRCLCFIVLHVFFGGIRGVLAYRQGIFKSELVPSVRLAASTLLIIVLPMALIPMIRLVTTPLARWGDFEIVLRLVGGATVIGTINGAFGGDPGIVVVAERNQRAWLR